MAVPVPQFTSAELQILSVTNSSTPGTFTTVGGIAGLDCLVENTGTNGAFLAFGMASPPTVKNTSGGVAGTAAIYIPASAIMVIGKGAQPYFAAITDTSSTTLIIHAGRGA